MSFSFWAYLTDVKGSTVAAKNILSSDITAVLDDSPILTGVDVIEIADSTLNNTFAKDVVYDTSGRIIRAHATNMKGLHAGVYIFNGKKVFIK